MKKSSEIIMLPLIAIFAIFVLAVFGGSIIWLLYPHIHALFPTAAESGVIASELSWWDSVCVTWIFSILFKSKISKGEK